MGQRLRSGCGRAASPQELVAEEVLRSTLDALSAHVAILTAGGVVAVANEAWLRFECEAALAGACFPIGIDYVEACDAARGRVRHAGELADALRAILGGDRRDFRLEYRCGEVWEPRWFHLRASLLPTASGARAVLAHEEITEVKWAEQALHQITGRLLSAEDDERRRIARELHDSTAQNLLAAKLALDRLSRKAGELSAPSRHILEEASALLGESQTEIRNISYLLHPPMLDELGLVAALEDFVRGFAERTGIEVELEITLPDRFRLPQSVETALFRIIQEALTNVHRHAGATTAQLSLSSDETDAPGHVVVSVKDNGCGLTGARNAEGVPQRRAGLGLIGMRERLRHLGGRIDVVGTLTGTIVTARVPVGPGEISR